VISEMEKFKNKDYDILVSTSVVEVGVNVPNATSILIEGAERFGLSQIHQLRGRVMRSSDQSYCYLFTNNNTEKTLKRLSALKKAATQKKWKTKTKTVVKAKPKPVIEEEEDEGC